jgi:leader peptidase (prepilin peptidase)/N-methyltransferase
MDYLMFSLVGLLGLAVGSFLNAAIYRVPRQIRLHRGRSICPHCGNRLKWHHNVPVISFVVLRGRCGFCGARISLRYPAVELITAAFYLFFFWQHGLTFNFGIFALLSSALVVIFFVDLDFQIIPDLITLPGMALGLAVSLVPGGLGIVDASIGLVVGGGALYLIALLGDWLFKKESMGGGDIKMAAMLGAFLGWQKVIFIFIASAVIGLLVSVIVMAFSSKLRQTRIIPYGPFLSLAAIVAIVYGDRLISLYLASVIGLQ